MKRAPGGYDAGQALIPYYNRVRQTFPILPPTPQIDADAGDGEAYFNGLTADGRPKFSVRDEYVIPEGTAVHECGHAYEAVLQRLAPRDYRAAYWQFRDFPGTPATSLAESNAQPPGTMGQWMYLPGEIWAEGFRVAILGGHEKSMDWGKPTVPVAMLAFFKSLMPAAPAPSPVIDATIPPTLIPGRCPFAVWDPSPNFTPGRPGAVLGTMEHSAVGSLAATRAILKDGTRGAARVSAHFTLGLGGELFQHVNTRDQAWHSMSCNGQYVGKEHVDNGNHADPVRTPAQYAMSAKVNRWLMREHPFAPSAVTIRRHRTCVATACPSGLDVERIIWETVAGGTMFDPRTNPADLAFLDERIRAIVLNEPQLTGYALGKITAQFGGGRTLTAISTAVQGGSWGAERPAEASDSPRHTQTPTDAAVRAGHGRAPRRKGGRK